MSNVIKIRKGLDIKLKGKAEKIFSKAGMSARYALKPTDFQGLTPKLKVNIDDKVKAGTPLFFDKYNPDVLFTSPVSGTVVEINRGERRRIEEVVVQADPEIEYEDFGKADVQELSRDNITAKLLQSGLWPFIRQRPYSIIANPKDEPRAIFISAFDTAPLAPDYDFIVKDQEKEFQAGINVLSKLTSGKIHLNVNADYPPSPVFSKAQGVQINQFTGPHPAGNVGIQIHHIDPIIKGSLVWYVNPQDVITIGRLFLNGIYDASKIIALTGSEVIKPKYYKLIAGSSIESIVKDNVQPGNLRHISGNVLTGTKILPSGYLGFYDSHVTVIPEGNHFEFIGWAKPGFNKFSMSRSFFSWLMPNREYKLDTNMNGGKRAYVMTGEYNKVLPMNIFPVQLIKSILVDDIDMMEKLGIYEVSEEDFALCEFVCTSKTEVQSIIRKGLDLMHKEMS
ncbi:MAG TPA: Na(+)-translocating NADH-quinone reductase subunit A [Bacteroidales bacterium]|nr:Na(+)-translocating NADH-quinone reductase subunit A [Bacteroidales bacterium]